MIRKRLIHIKIKKNCEVSVNKLEKRRYYEMFMNFLRTTVKNRLSKNEP